MPRTATVHLLGGDYAERLNNLWTQANQALKDEKVDEGRTTLEGSTYLALKADYDTLKAEAIADGTTVHLAAVGRREWRALKVKFPPRSGEGVDPEVAKGDRLAGVNVDDVEDDLVYESVKSWVEDSGESVPYASSRAAFDDWADTLSEGEWQELVVRSWGLTNEARVDPKELPSSQMTSDG